ncbi:MAG: esterase/lipase family protein [Thermodesulfovibrionales bacterium]
MRLDIEFYQGERHLPAIVFIHGLGMDKNLWTSVSEARIAGGLLPYSLLLKERPQEIHLSEPPIIKPEPISAGNSPLSLSTSYHDLREAGYSVIAWSQRRPVGPISAAIDELCRVIEFISSFTDRGVILIGHSRGGLIARRYVELYGMKRVCGIITIATPHKGSTMAGWVRYLSNITSALNPLLRYLPEGKVSKTLKRINEFLKSEAIKELLPESSFIKSLRPVKEINFFSIAGTEPHLFSLYRWDIQRKNNEFILRTEEIFSFPESLIPLIPERHIPPEWRSGSGDGLVSLESARLQQCCEFRLSHAKILTNQEVRAYIRRVVKGLS